MTEVYHPSYQKIGNGSSGEEGHVRTSLDKPLFGSDISGQTLLDIGSAEGHFCFEAIRKGVMSATGLETSPERVRQARAIAERLNLPATFIEADIEDWTADAQSFDIVLCLNVLHHLYDPIATLRKLLELTKDRLFLEIAHVSRKEIRKSSPRWAMLGAERAPIMLLGDPKSYLEAADRTFTFTERAIEIIINKHTSAFEPVVFHQPEFEGRIIVEVRRRQIDHLIVVAGVTSSGKSTFIKSLNTPAMKVQFGVGDDALVTRAEAIHELPRGPLATVILHYDVLRPFERSVQSHRRDPAFGIFECAKRISWINLGNTPEVLRERIAHEIAPKAGKERTSKRHRLIQANYERPQFIRAWYESRLDSVRQFTREPANHLYFIQTNDDYTDSGSEESFLNLFR